MRIACPHCSAEYNVDDRRIPAGGLNVRCPKCQKTFPVRKAVDAGGAASTAVPLPAPQGAPAPLGEPPRAAPASAGAAIPLPAPPASPAAKVPPAPPAAEPLGFGEVPLDEGPPPPLPPAPQEEAASLPEAEEEVSFATASEKPEPSAPEAVGEEPLPPLPIEEPPPPPPAVPKAEPAPAPPRAAAPGSLGRAETEELEMLFGEGGKPKAVAVGPLQGNRPPGYRVRRRSGKIFGPFEERRIVEMLGKGELLGNEDVSTDGDTWTPMASVPAFEAALARLMESPGAASSPSARPPTPFVSRMAEGKLARDAEAGPAGRRRRLPLIAAGAALLLVLGTGLGAGLTRHGIFFLKAFRHHGDPKRPGAALLGQARSGFAEDTFPGLRRALDLADQALRLDSDDAEAKGVYGQATGWMVRRGAGETALPRARQLATEIQKTDRGAPDALKASLSLALAAERDAVAQAAAALEALAARAPPDEDALQLLGEAALARGDPKKAAAWFGRMAGLRAGSARAEHGLALAARAAGDTKAAVGHLEAALAADPRHLASAVELADLSAGAGDAAKAEATLRKALAPDPAAQLAPRERGSARLLLAGLLARGSNPARLDEAGTLYEAALGDEPGDLHALTAYARFLLRRGMPERAVAILGPAEGGAAQDPEFVLQYTRALAGTGRALDATSRVDAALLKYPGKARLLFAKGLVSEQSGKRADAAKAYEQAVAADPGDWEPRVALGRIALRGGDLTRAGQELPLAAEKAPLEPEAQVGLGDLKLARGDVPGAEAAYRKALELDPEHAGGHYGMARIALALGDNASARAELERALKSWPRYAEALSTYGTLLWRTGDLEAAAKALQAVVALESQNALARARLGAVQLARGQVDQALADLAAATSVDLNLAEGQFWLGRALLAKGEAAQAVDRLKRAVELEPQNAEYHLHLAMALERSGSVAEAADEYRVAMARDPRSPEAFERLGLLLATAGNCDEAIPQLQKALRVAPALHRIRVEIGDCRQKSGQHREAIRVYKEALKADPRLTAVYYKIARSIHDSVGMREALPWYERAAREEKGNAMAHYYLGYAYKERGQKAKALHEFKAYLRLRPEADDKKDVEREIEDLGG